VAYDVDDKSLFDLARAFGEEGRRFAFDATEKATAEATLKAENALGRCLQRAWPTSSIHERIRRRVVVNNKGIFGILTIVHNWVEVLVLGKNVPPHRIPKTGTSFMTLRVGKRNALKTDPRTGRPPVRPLVPSHPGYKGKDCASEAIRVGGRLLMQRMARAAFALAKRLTSR
jgi:hypothetical protein